MSDTKWKGSRDLVQQKLKWSFDAENETLVVPYVGPLSVCLARRPKAGQTLAGFTDDGLKVARVEIEEGDGTSATMNVHLSAPVAPADEGSTEQLGEPVFELDMTGMTKPLERHPKCGILNLGRSDHPKLKRIATWDDWAVLRDIAEDGGTGDYDPSGGAWTVDTYKRLREKGVEGFDVAFPVVRRTLFFLHAERDRVGFVHDSEPADRRADARRGAEHRIPQDGGKAAQGRPAAHAGNRMDRRARVER